MSALISIDPATGDPVWQGEAASAADVGAAVARAREAFARWSAQPVPDRELRLRAFARALEGNKARLVEAICREVGKPRWEAETEVKTMIGKVELSIQAFAQRCHEFGAGAVVTRFRPHGVIAVFGPFNFPGHLPNGHIVPALLAGNTVVFKPSERAPWVAELMAAAWHEAQLPAGVFNLAQGPAATGAALAGHPGIDGLFFTGSGQTGLALAQSFAATPERILALEMGGNNPLVVWEPDNLAAAALLTVQSAYLSAGQRCSCARRLIVADDERTEAFLAELRRLIGRIRVGAYTESPEPFMGPVISAAAAEAVLAAQADWAARGGKILVESRWLKPGTGLVSPGLVDVTDLAERRDKEIFGPLLQLVRVPDFAAAIAEANRTHYGLSAGLIGGTSEHFAAFRSGVRAGVVNWNHPLPGASGAAPFGGVGRSGNHRPSAFFAADYCSFPVATMETSFLAMPAQYPAGFTAPQA
jgi:succinylglutamic semialdehyde dehydrogenase